MSHTVAVGEFEGPLGVLLDLVERQKLPVTQVSVGAITKEYLARVSAMSTDSVEDLTEFIQLGSRLLYIKSLSLLPGSTDSETASELAQLTAELEEYRRYAGAARQLAACAKDRRTWERPAGPRLTASELPLPELTLTQLAEAFTRALKNMPEVRETAVIKPHVSLEQVAAGLRRKLAGGFELHTVIEGCRDRLEIIVTFLAVLELVRGGAAVVRQAGQFDSIRVEAARG